MAAESKDASQKKKRGRPPAHSGPGAKERLVKAARRLFARQGYDGTSVHDIATEAGVADSALYGHFTGKGEIYQALMHEGGPDVLIDALRHVDQSAIDDPKAFLRRLFERVFEVWSAPPARTFMSIFTRDALDGRTQSTGILSGIDSAQESLGAVIRAWQRRGIVNPSLNPKQVVFEIIAPLTLIRFVFLQARSTRLDIQRGKEFARRHIDYVLASLFIDD
jgi:AcrR family transcriptional regulator